MTKQPHEAQVCHLMISKPVIHKITWITTHLPTLKCWKAELAWLVDHLRTLYARTGQLPTIDNAQGRESPPSKERRPNH